MLILVIDMLIPSGGRIINHTKTEMRVGSNYFKLIHALYTLWIWWKDRNKNKFQSDTYIHR